MYCESRNFDVVINGDWGLGIGDWQLGIVILFCLVFYIMKLDFC